MMRPVTKLRAAGTPMIELCPGICCTINTGVREAPELLDVSDTPDIGKLIPSPPPGKGWDAAGPHCTYPSEQHARKPRWRWREYANHK